MARIAVEIETRPEGNLARVTIENIAKANCLTSALVSELETAFRGLADDGAAARGDSAAQGLDP